MTICLNTCVDAFVERLLRSPIEILYTFLRFISLNILCYHLSVLVWQGIMYLDVVLRLKVGE